MNPPAASIGFQTDKPLRDYGPLAAQAEECGFDGVSCYNDLLFQPAWPPLLEMARATRRVRLGPAAVNPFTCHPVNLAGQIALLDEASAGRAYLGLARGAWLDYLGLQPPAPAEALREALECVRHLLAGNRDPYRGRFFQLAGGHALRWQIPRRDVPFLLGSWGSRTIASCAALVDEIKIGGTANPAAVRRVREITSKAAQAAGRPAGAIALVAGSVCVVDRDSAAARRRARREAALYLPVIAALDPDLGMEPERLQRLRDAVAAGAMEQAGQLIPEAVLLRLALAGNPHQVADQALELYAAGAQRVEFGTPHGLAEAEGIALLGREVLPVLRRAWARL